MPPASDPSLLHPGTAAFRFGCRFAAPRFLCLLAATGLAQLPWTAARFLIINVEKLMDGQRDFLKSSRPSPRTAWGE
jgi:hypothetical protein